MTVSPRCPNCHPERGMGGKDLLAKRKQWNLALQTWAGAHTQQVHTLTLRALQAWAGPTQQAHTHTASCYRPWVVSFRSLCFFHWLPLSSFRMPLGQNRAHCRVDCWSHLGWMHLGWSLEFAFHASSQVGLLSWGPHLDNLQSTIVSWGRETVIHPPWFFALTRC